MWTVSTGYAVIVSYSDETTSIYPLTSNRVLTPRETLSDREPLEADESQAQGK